MSEFNWERNRLRPRLLVGMDRMPIRVTPTALDRLVGWINPRAGRNRLQHRAALQRTYEGAALGRRTDGWWTPSRSANAEIGPALTRLRNRVRDLARNNPYAKAAIRGIVKNTVGTGITPRFLGSERAVKQAKDLWNLTMGTPSIDAGGRGNFSVLQKLVMNTGCQSGEVLVRRRVRQPGDGLLVPLQLQVIEPDHLDTMKDGRQENGNTVIQGVEFDRIGRRAAYWLFPDHPGEAAAWSARSFESQRVEASEILHVFEQERPGQARGVPAGAAVILRSRNWDEYSDATLQKQIVAACYAAFEIDADPENPSTGGPLEVDSMESGTVQKLGPGRDVKFSNPPQVNDIEAYASVTLHEIAAGWAVPYELMTSDYSRTNYSSARMAWNDFGQNIEDWQWNLMIPQFCQPVFQWWLDIAYLSGALTLPVSVSWRPPKKRMLDPTKEIPALRAGIRAGLIPLSQALEQDGEDFDEVMQEYRTVNKKLDALEIILDSDPRKVTLSGILQAGDVPDSEQPVAKK